MTAKGVPIKPPVSFDLARFEELAGNGDPLALPMLHQVLDHIETGGGLSAAGGDGAVEIATETMFMRLATAIRHAKPLSPSAIRGENP